MSDTNSTVRLYGVAFGNGNDGVSRHCVAYAVRTDDPYTLAAAAMVGDGATDREWLVETTEVDGEADYGITATLSDPAPADDNGVAEEADEDGEWRVKFNDGDVAYFETEEDAQEAFDSQGWWSDHNGAYRVVEVFPLDDASDVRAVFASLEEAFDAETLEAARSMH